MRRRGLDKRWLLLLAALLLIPMLVACGQQAPPAPASQVEEQTATESTTEESTGEETPAEEATTGEPVVVTFASWVGDSEMMRQLADEFNAENPNITIDFQTVPFEEIRTKLLTQVAANNPPDTAFMDAVTVADFASRGALINLDDRIAGSDAIDLDDYVPAFLNPATYEGSVYGLPIDGETTGLFYRTDLFEEAGIDGPPATWEEFRAAAEALTDPAAGRYGVAMFAPEAAYYWYPWLWQAGGELVSDDGQDVLFNTPEGIRAAEFYADLTQFAPPDYLNSNSWDGRVAFAEGTVGMYIAGAWFAGTLMDEFPDINGKWATAPLPEDKECATTIAGDILVAFEGSKNPDAAWKWIEFLSRPENMARWTLGTPEAPSTLLPPRQSLLEDPQTFESVPVLQGFADTMACARAQKAVQPKWPEVESMLNEYLGAVMYGEMEAAAALEEAAAEAEAIID